MLLIFSHQHQKVLFMPPMWFSIANSSSPVQVLILLDIQRSLFHAPLNSTVCSDTILPFGRARHATSWQVFRLHWKEYWLGSLQSWSSSSPHHWVTEWPWVLSSSPPCRHFLPSKSGRWPTESKSAPTIYNSKFIERTLRRKNLGCLP